MPSGRVEHDSRVRHRLSSILARNTVGSKTLSPPMPSPKSPLGLGHLLRNDIYAITGGEPLRPVTSTSKVSATRFARCPIRRPLCTGDREGWMMGDGEPVRSVCLTDEGRRLAQ